METIKDKIESLSKGISYVLKLNGDNLCYFNSIMEAREGLNKVAEEICDSTRIKSPNCSIIKASFQDQ